MAMIHRRAREVELQDFDASYRAKVVWVSLTSWNWDIDHDGHWEGSRCGGRLLVELVVTQLASVHRREPDPEEPAHKVSHCGALGLFVSKIVRLVKVRKKTYETSA